MVALSRAKCQAFKSILDSGHTLVPKNTYPRKLIMWKKELYNSGYMFSECHNPHKMTCFALIMEKKVHYKAIEMQQLFLFSCF